MEPLLVFFFQIFQFCCPTNTCKKVLKVKNFFKVKIYFFLFIQKPRQKSTWNPLPQTISSALSLIMPTSRQALSFQEKDALRLFKAQNPNVTQQTCQKWFLETFGKRITQSTISEILAYNNPRRVRNPNRQRESSFKYPDLDPLLYRRAVEIQENGGVLTYPLLQHLAYELWPSIYNCPPANISVGMMQRFAARNNLSVTSSRDLGGQRGSDASNSPGTSCGSMSRTPSDSITRASSSTPIQHHITSSPNNRDDPQIGCNSNNELMKVNFLDDFLSTYPTAAPKLPLHSQNNPGHFNSNFHTHLPSGEMSSLRSGSSILPLNDNIELGNEASILAFSDDFYKIQKDIYMLSNMLSLPLTDEYSLSILQDYIQGNLYLPELTQCSTSTSST